MNNVIKLKQEEPENFGDMMQKNKDQKAQQFIEGLLNKVKLAFF